MDIHNGGKCVVRLQAFTIGRSTSQLQVVFSGKKTNIQSVFPRLCAFLVKTTSNQLIKDRIAIGPQVQ